MIVVTGTRTPRWQHLRVRGDGGRGPVPGMQTNCPQTKNEDEDTYPILRLGLAPKRGMEYGVGERPLDSIAGLVGIPLLSLPSVLISSCSNLASIFSSISSVPSEFLPNWVRSAFTSDISSSLRIEFGVSTLGARS